VPAILDLENELLATLTEHLAADSAVELTEGGSPARIVRLRTPDSRLIVLKLLVDIPGAVDGHDLASFRTKIKQIAKIRREASELGSIYTDLDDRFHGAGWSAYTMPFYPNEDISACLREESGGLDVFWARMFRVFSDLISLGYLRASEPAVPGNIVDTHVDRLARRFHLLERYLPPELTQAPMIVINGVSCRNPLQLARYLGRSGALAAIDPVRLYYPVHGDLNTRNILMTNGSYRIIDPRGTLDYWDPAYDVAKVLFSLTVWDAGLRRGFAIDDRGEWRVSIRGGTYPGYRQAAAGLLSKLRSMGVFAELTAGDRGWDSRYLLGHAFHLLAEAACRLSDIKKRTSEVADCTLSPIELATGHYLYGALFLEDAARQLAAHGEIDGDAALSLLDRR
jgi:hypothetical protein